MTPGAQGIRVCLLAAVTQALLAIRAMPAAAQVPDPVSIVTETVSGAGGWAFDGVAEGITAWVLGAVAFFVNGVLDFLRTSARPDVESAWFAGRGSPYAAVRDIAVLLLVGFVFLAVLQGLLHGDPGAMVRRVVGAVPVAVAGMVVSTAVVAHLLVLTDAMSDAVLAGTDHHAMRFLSGFGADAAVATGGFAVVLLGLVAVAAALLLWVELMVRTSLVYLLVAISPLGFAALVWPAARGLLRRIIEILLAVILSKFVIAVAMAIGVSALAGAGDATTPDSGLAGSAGASTGTLLAGSVVLGLAAFSPFLVLKLVPFAEAAIVAQGVSRGPTRSAQSAMSTYSKAQSIGRVSGADRFAASSQRGAESTARSDPAVSPTRAAPAPPTTPAGGLNSGPAGAQGVGGAHGGSAAAASAVVGAARAGAQKVKATADAPVSQRDASARSEAPKRSVRKPSDERA